MVRVRLDVFNGSRIKILRISNLVDEAFMLQFADRLSDTAHGYANLDAIFSQMVSQVFGGSNGSPANTGLVDETIFVPRHIGHKISRVFGHEELSLVRCRFGSPRSNLAGIANGVNFDNVVNVRHVNGSRNVGEGNERIGDNDNFVSILGIYGCIAENTAVTAVSAAESPAVAHIIGTRSTNEGNVNMDFTRFDGTDTAAVTAHDGKAFQFAVGNGFTNLAAHAGSLDVRDGAIFDHRDNRGLGLTQGSRANGQVFDAHLVDGFHDHVDNIVPFTEMMMEGEGHAIFDAAFFRTSSMESTTLL